MYEALALGAAFVLHLALLSWFSILPTTDPRSLQPQRIQLTTTVRPRTVYLPSHIELPRNPLSAQPVSIPSPPILSPDPVREVVRPEITPEPVDAVEERNLEDLIQEQESELSLLELPSASLPAVPKGLGSDPEGLSIPKEIKGENSGEDAASNNEPEGMGEDDSPNKVGPVSSLEQIFLQKSGSGELPADYFLRSEVTSGAKSSSVTQESAHTQGLRGVLGNQDGFQRRNADLDLGGDGFFTLSNYQWPYESYMGRWAKLLRFAWNSQPPSDYLSGLQPSGGEVRVQVEVSRLGELLSFEVLGRLGGSSEMEESVVNAILSVSSLPPLPSSFSDQTLIVRFRFIYPALR